MDNKITYKKIFERREEEGYSSFLFCGHPFDRSTYFLRKEMYKVMGAYIIDLTGTVRTEDYELNCWEDANLRSCGWEEPTYVNIRFNKLFDLSVVKNKKQALNAIAKYMQTQASNYGVDKDVFIIGMTERVLLDENILESILMIADETFKLRMSIDSLYDDRSVSATVLNHFETALIAGKKNIVAYEGITGMKPAFSSNCNVIYINRGANEMQLVKKPERELKNEDIVDDRVKTYVLDKYVVLNDPNAIANLEENTVVIPAVVLEELARMAAKYLQIKR